LRTTDNPAEVYAGFEFKQSNNNLLFYTDATTRVPALTNQTDVFQFVTGGSMIRRDKRGAWVFGANFTFSPGRVNARNSELAFNNSRAFSNPRYFYGQLTFQRLVNLSYGWDFMSRGVGQYAHHNLLSSEELFVGGGSSVRGYNENVFGGDSGYFLSNELLSPAIKRRIRHLPQNRDMLETRFVGFFDTARVRVHERTNIDPPVSSLASAGLGVRMNIAGNFSLTADYGWQLSYLPYHVDKPRRGHIKATLAF
jgi:hemolysin activation/secretion protein